MNACAKCGGPLPPRKANGYCNACHASYMREWRKTHPLSPEAREKDISRSYGASYVRRGKLKREPCEICGAPAEMNRRDYSRPLDIRWLCRRHRLGMTHVKY